MYFGKTGLLFLLIIGFSFPLQSIEVQLSKSVASPGETIILSIKVDSGQDLQKLESEFHKDGVRAVYQGFSSETQIVNFKVYRSQVINFYIQERREGKHSVPPIRVSIDGKPVQLPDMSFVIKKGKQRPNPFGTFFGGIDDESSSEPPQVKFHSNKSKVYVGEPLVGYFALYQKNMKAPFLERDPNHAISFPYFVSEVLPNVSIEIPDSPNPILVYEKEIYGLTPLKAGTHAIGKTQFLVGDSLRLGSFHEATLTEPTKITVLPIPQPTPIQFQGAVGEYEGNFKLVSDQVFLGEPIFFEVTVSGRGGGQGIIIPPPYQVIEKKKETKFKSLESGDPDFYSEIGFTISIEPKIAGAFQPPPISINFFSPKTGSFGEIILRFPSVIVKEPRPVLSPKEVSVSPKESRSWGFWGIALLFGFVFSFGFLYWMKRQEKQRLLTFLDSSLGKKRGSLLGDYLQEKGISTSESTELVRLRTAFSDKSLPEIFALCDLPTQRQILSISERLRKMEIKR